MHAETMPACITLSLSSLVFFHMRTGEMLEGEGAASCYSSTEGVGVGRGETWDTGLGVRDMYVCICVWMYGCI